MISVSSVAFDSETCLLQRSMEPIVFVDFLFQALDGDPDFLGRPGDSRAVHHSNACCFGCVLEEIGILLTKL